MKKILITAILGGLFLGILNESNATTPETKVDRPPFYVSSEINH